MQCANCGSVLPPSNDRGICFCEDCSLSYRGAAQRMEFDLIALAQSIGISRPGASLSHDPATKTYDCCVVFHAASSAAAGRAASILAAAGYNARTVESHGNCVLEIQDGMRTARRVIILVSAPLLRTTYGGSEWRQFLQKDPDGRERVLTVIDAEREDLDLKTAVLRAAGSFYGRQQFAWSYREPSPARLADAEDGKAQGSVGFLPVTAMLGMAALLALVPAVPVVMSADVQLPFSWMFYGGDMRARSTIESDPDPLRHWEGLRGAAASLPRARQWLELRETALLRLSQPALDGIAQYSMAFDKGGVYLLTRTNQGGDVRYETRLEFKGPGQIQVRVRRRNGRDFFDIPHGRIAPVEVATRTRHDVAISMQGELQTLWLNGRAITTFRDPHLTAGSVGLKVDSSDHVRLFRWSVNLDTDPQLSAVPSIQPKLLAGLR